MRVGVIGAGALGSVYAYALAVAGHDVQLVARGDSADVIGANGLTVLVDNQPGIAKVDVVTQLERPDLVMLAVKAQDAREALQQHSKSFGSAHLVVVQNGLRGVSVASEFHQPERVIGAISLIAAHLRSPGVAVIGSPQRTLLGSPAGVTDDVRRITGVLDAALSRLHPDLRANTIDNFEGAAWTKLVLNTGNALPAVVNRSVQDIGSSWRLRRIQAAAMQEAATVGQAGGVRWGRLGPLDADVLASVASGSLRAATRLARRLAGSNGGTPNFASTWQSVSRGRPTEVDFLNGEVSARGRALGVSTPVNDELTRMVHEVERTGVFLSSREAIRRVRTARGKAARER